MTESSRTRQHTLKRTSEIFWQRLDKPLMKAIEVEHLSKVYPGGIRAVDDISFDVEEGEVWGFLGPNGAGKTTTIRMIITLGVPTSGSIKVFGLSTSAKTLPR
jgi:ABC-type multidrug transport system ATPase subunit